MIKRSSTFISGVLAFTAYFIVVGLLIFYFNTRTENESVHFVKKDQKRIQVTLSSPEKLISPTRKSKKKPKKKSKSKPKVKRKKVLKKKVIKEKIVKKRRVKKKDHNTTKPKKNAKDLFKNIKTSKKKKINIQVSDKPIREKSKNNVIKVTSISASDRIKASLKSQKMRDKGVENAYFAHVQSILEAWPAQSNYAGEKAKVILHIQPNGYFEFKIVSYSNIPEFNQGLRDFLEQLQEIGFGPHNGGRTYHFEAEFIAKD